MRRDYMTWGIFGLYAALSLTTGCGLEAGPISTVEGRVSDDDGAQALRFGGEGAISAASRVRAVAVGNGGTLETLHAGDVRADGRFTLEVPAEQTRLLLEAIDERGDVVASAILEHSGADGETVRCTPLDSESSLEAALFLVMATRAPSVADVNVVDLRTRVTARLAAAVREKEEGGEDVSADVLRLAEAVLAAQATEVRAFAGEGVDVTQRDLFELELEASRALSAALYDEDANAAEAYDAFYAALDEVTAELGLTPDERARAESSAGFAFRAVVEERVRANTPAARWVTESALLAAALVEGRAYETATLALIDGAEVDERTREAAEAAARELRDDITLASSSVVAAQAFRQLAATLIGEADPGASLLGGLLRLDAGASLSVEAALAESAEATSDLDQALKRLAQRALVVPGDIDVVDFGIEVSRAYSAHHGALLRANDDLAAAVATDPELAVGLVVLAETAFRLGE